MHILIVEDEKRLAQIVKQALEEEGHVVELAHDGEQGFEFASTGSYDVIVLDWLLPKLQGPEVTRRLRKAKVATPVLMLTARDAVADRVEGLDAGADDYLVKPFAFQELSARLRSLARRKVETREPALLTFGKLAMDLKAHHVSYDGQTIDLTPKEFALLEYFLRNQGKVHTREQIADRVWGYGSDITNNVVDLYVHYLRNKFDQKGAKELVKTVRGVGYALRSE